MSIIKSALIFAAISYTAVSVPNTEWGQQDCWTVEADSPTTEISWKSDTLEIVTPRGLTYWNNVPLKGKYTISYRIAVIVDGGKYDRLSDLNCFWGASDTAHPDNLFADAALRHGFFPSYKSLRLFYVGYGGNHNTTTRFRRYHGGGNAYSPDDEVRPLLGEYLDKAHLLMPNHWYSVTIQTTDSTTTYKIDDEVIFSTRIAPGKADGHFGLRLLNNHIKMTGFRCAENK